MLSIRNQSSKSILLRRDVDRGTTSDQIITESATSINPFPNKLRRNARTGTYTLPPNGSFCGSDVSYNFAPNQSLYLAHYDDTNLINYAGGSTVFGGVTRSSAQSKFGGYSANFPSGSSDYISVPSSTGIELNSGDFTISYWFYASGNFRLASTRGSDGGWLLICAPGSSSGAFAIFAPTYAQVNFPLTPVINQWNHAVITRQGSNHVAWLNGSPGVVLNSALRPKINGQDLQIGRDRISPSTNPYEGYIDEFIITKEVLYPVSNWASVPNITIQSAPFNW